MGGDMSRKPAMMSRLPALAVCALILNACVGLSAHANDPGPQSAAKKTMPSLPAVSPDEDMLVNSAAGAGLKAELTSTGDPDEDAVLAARRDLDSKGVLSVREHEAALRKVLADMPRPFTRVQTVDGKTIYRADSMDDCIALHPTGQKPAKDGSTSFVCKGNPFPTAGFYLGLYFNEIGQFDKALVVLDAGLLAAPRSPALSGERGASLMQLGRFAEGLTNADNGLAIDNLADRDRARLYRSRGYALTELNRLDEAEAAYVTSLQIEPNNTVAPHEIAYIQGLRKGRNRTPSILTPLQPSQPKSN